MPIPQPKVPLDGICSVIYENTLYTYSSSAFQALALEPGAEWQTLASGDSVTGGVCVGSTPKDPSQAGFFIIGGKGSSPDYKGIQKFSYLSRKWERIVPKSTVTDQRQWHGAVYVNSTDSILVFAGSQNGSPEPSMETFTIGASAPHEVRAFDTPAPLSVNPILLPWSDSQAVLVGGSEGNTRVMLFDAKNGWYDSNTTLATPLPKDSINMKAAIVQGDSGCKNLYTFDMSTSPNRVTRTVLLNDQKQGVKNSPTLGNQRSRRRKSPSRAETRALTLDQWPEYNATLAPTLTRTNYALAEDPNGLVVIAGGNNEDVLCMFDGRSNSWQNATARLTGRQVSSFGLPSSTPSASDSIATTTPSATPLSSSGVDPAAAPPPPPAPPNTMDTNTLLGIVFGSLAGATLILVVAYLLIRRYQKRQTHMEAGHARRASGLSSPEKGGFGFASDSLPHGQQAKSTFRGHNPEGSQGSFSSMAILMGHVKGKRQSGIQRNNSKESRRSSGSSIFNKAFKTSISKPMPPMAQHPALAPIAVPPEPRDELRNSQGRDLVAGRPRAGSKVDRQGSLRRSSGWNRYWSGGSAMSVFGLGSSNNASSNAMTKRSTAYSDSSQYSDQRRITQDSATVPPLQTHPMPQPKPQFNRVNSGSPTMAHFDARGQNGVRGHIERPVSQGSSHSGYSSGIPASVHENWDPTAFSNKPWGTDRAPSSAYSSNFTTQYVPPSASQQPAAPSGISRQPQLAMAATSSDMSWLNLGQDRPRY